MPFRHIEYAWWSGDAASPDLSVLAAGRAAPRGKDRACLQLLGTVTALGTVAGALPSPWMAGDLLRGRRGVQSNTLAGADVGDAAMLLLASVAVWLLLLWAFIAAGAALTSRLPGSVGRHGRTVLARVAPAAARRVLLAAVGASMVTGVAACGTGPAAATSAGPGAPSADSAGTAQIDDSRVDRSWVTAGQTGSWITVEGSAVHLRPAAGAVTAPPLGTLDIDWPTLAPARSSTTVRVAADGPAATGDGNPDAPVDIDWPTARTPAAGAVVVVRGDSLWSIAARHLAPEATPDDIDRAWRRWFSANAAVIGINPNLILPGQILLPPNPGTGN